MNHTQLLEGIRYLEFFRALCNKDVNYMKIAYWKESNVKHRAEFERYINDIYVNDADIIITRLKEV